MSGDDVLARKGRLRVRLSAERFALSRAASRLLKGNAAAELEVARHKETIKAIQKQLEDL